MKRIPVLLKETRILSRSQPSSDVPDTFGGSGTEGNFDGGLVVAKELVGLVMDIAMAEAMKIDGVKTRQIAVSRLGQRTDRRVDINRSEVVYGLIIYRVIIRRRERNKGSDARLGESEGSGEILKGLGVHGVGNELRECIHPDELEWTDGMSALV
ncbi:hypothetical protein SARC_03540 [Sphaeroforma arctica JP610]|uniref:Uncharacterized protein n=1 Tax=Sphaeroforma arctica JP610 TaxID=667725 RepID=A0A0L0G5D4_9EUKA|nr:hypothetical protein SARC_03540 [Sphaeroforma arctica JP610]KNC84240.1 hypothetical protein SARC_03540 [Sphaeroforma arctica JP610]|eukprot:XP_014158142.1 hypothetical protein SARC_03540 [Sphaeroforma arctica JP610]